MTDMQVRYQQHLEEKRSNLVREEQARNELAEAIRTHMANEQIATATLQETSQHNRATESLGKAELREATRSHKTNEKISAGQLSEQKRTNKAKETETKRSNLANETIRQYANDISRMLADSKILVDSTNVKKIINDMSRAGIDTMLKSKNPIVAYAGLAMQAADIISNPNTSKAQKDAAKKLLQQGKDFRNQLESDSQQFTAMGVTIDLDDSKTNKALAKLDRALNTYVQYDKKSRTFKKGQDKSANLSVSKASKRNSKKKVTKKDLIK